MRSLGILWLSPFAFVSRYKLISEKKFDVNPN